MAINGGHPHDAHEKHAQADRPCRAYDAPWPSARTEKATGFKRTLPTHRPSRTKCRDASCAAQAVRRRCNKCVAHRHCVRLGSRRGFTLHVSTHAYPPRAVDLGTNPNRGVIHDARRTRPPASEATSTSSLTPALTSASSTSTRSSSGSSGLRCSRRARPWSALVVRDS